MPLNCERAFAAPTICGPHPLYTHRYCQRQTVHPLHLNRQTLTMTVHTTLPKKSSFTRRFTDMINQKTTPRRASLSDGTKGGTVTPPKQTTTPSSSSSPLSIQSMSSSSPQSTRYTFDEQHRLPITFLPFLSTDTHFLKGLDVFAEPKTSPRSSFEFNDSPVESEDNWFSLCDNQTSSFNVTERRARSQSKATTGSSVKDVTIGWICEDGFKPIGEFD